MASVLQCKFETSPTLVCFFLLRGWAPQRGPNTKIKHDNGTRKQLSEFEDVSPIKHGDFPTVMLVFWMIDNLSKL